MAELPEFASLDLGMTEDRFRWFSIDVDGRRAVGGVGGRDGPPVIFLHGWALGSHTYKKALSRLMRRGCQVYVPALPSFGGTADLPTSEATLSGYARWLRSFMSAVGVEEPALVIGHSFGGGVALKLAAQFPDAVSYLVLLNAVGGVAGRPSWEWLAGFAREAWPPWSGIELARAVQSDLLPNLVGNPLGLIRIARLAQQADLRKDAEQVRSCNIPVLALTGRADEVIPRAAFDALCEAIGADGRVVIGGHSWMLADPDSLAAEIAPVIESHVSGHKTRRAAATGGQLSELLTKMRVPRKLAIELIRDAPPLWLLSETAPVLAADLALCHPKLKRHEVRAVARPILESRATRLTIVTADRRGLLADSAALLASSGLSITRASAATWTRRRLALHSFVVEGDAPVTVESWEQIGRKLRVMAATTNLPAVRTSPPERITVDGGDSEGDQALVTITVRDEVGALSNLCRVFADHGVSIDSLHAKSSGGLAIDTFLLSGVSDASGIPSWFAPGEFGENRRQEIENPYAAPRNAASGLTRRSSGPVHLSVVR